MYKSIKEKETSKVSTGIESDGLTCQSFGIPQRPLLSKLFIKAGIKMYPKYWYPFVIKLDGINGGCICHHFQQFPYHIFKNLWSLAIRG